MRPIKAKRLAPQYLRLLKTLATEGVRCWSVRWFYREGYPTTRQYRLWALQKPAEDRDPVWGEFTADAERVEYLVKHGFLDGRAADATGDRIDYALTAKAWAVLTAQGEVAPADAEAELFDQPGVDAWQMAPASARWREAA